jgi:hypothetical protein
VNLADLALEAAVLKVLADEIAARQQAVKAQLTDRFVTFGATQSVPALPSGTKVATVSLAGGGGNTPSVLHETPFLNWVASNYPGEIELKVRDNFKKVLLDRAKRAGKPVDTATGEVIPGVVMRPSTPYVSVRLKPGGGDAIVAAWRAGDLGDVDITTPRAIEGDQAA